MIAIAGVGLIGMMGTGLYVWGTKWRMRRRAHLTKRVVSTAVIGLAALALLQAQAPYPRTFTGDLVSEAFVTLCAGAHDADTSRRAIC